MGKIVTPVGQVKGISPEAWSGIADKIDKATRENRTLWAPSDGDANALLVAPGVPVAYYEDENI